MIFEPCSSSSQALACIYCPQPAEPPCDSSSPACLECQSSRAKSLNPRCRLILAIAHLGQMESGGPVLISRGWAQEKPLLCGVRQAWQSHLGTPGAPVDQEGGHVITVFRKLFLLNNRIILSNNEVSQNIKQVTVSCSC